MACLVILRPARGRRFLAISLLFLGGASAAATLPERAMGQSNDGTIAGRVRINAASRDDSVRAATLVRIRLLARGSRSPVEALMEPDGRFHFDNIEPGDTYIVEVAAAGFATARTEPLSMRVGRHIDVGLLVLAPVTARLSPVEVRPAVTTVDVTATGASHVVTGSTVRRAPLESADVAELFALVPGVSGGSVRGTNVRHSSILVDGTLETDVFGLTGGTGMPGAQEGARAVPVTAVEAVRVAFAPFDVRHSGFTGAEINMLTRSGGNTVHGVTSLTFQNQAFVGPDASGHRAASFDTYDLGGAVGGPIVRDRLHVFGAAQFRRRASPSTGPLLLPGTTGFGPAGISPDSAARFASILRHEGLEPGSSDAFTTTNLGTTLFGKVSAQTSERGALDVSLSYATSTTDGVLAAPRVANGDYRFTSAAYSPRGTTWAARGSWHAEAVLAEGLDFANDLRLATVRTSEPRETASDGPAVFVAGVGTAGARLVAGADPASQRLALAQRVLELVDDATMARGAHIITAGAQLQHFTFAYTNTANAVGQYQFLTLDSLAAGRPSRFIRTIASPSGADAARFGAWLTALYMQDAWSPTERLTLTAGLRADRWSYAGRPPVNSALLASPLAVNTGTFIRPSVLWAPRLGGNWAVADRTLLRGGVGVFSGRNPFSWTSDAYISTGVGTALMNCAGKSAPRFTADPAAQPVACADGTASSTPAIVYFAPGFRMPQIVKVGAGIDRVLPRDISGSLDLAYDYGLSTLYITDDNLRPPSGALVHEGGRLLYGTIAATSRRSSLPVVTPTLVVPALGPVLRNANHSGDRVASATVRFDGRVVSGVEVAAAYSYTRAEDYFSSRDARAASNYGFAALDGALTSRDRGTSIYSVPHALTLVMTVSLPYATALSLVEIARSGSPFTYVVSGDANGDGVGNRAGAFDRQLNDPVYSPFGASDIALVRDSVTTGSNTLLVAASRATYDSLDAFVRSESCLAEQRGRLVARNSCRNPAFSTLNARVVKRFASRTGPGVDVIVDVYNLAHLLSDRWGLVRETGTLSGLGSETVPLLRLRGQELSGGRNRYDLTLPVRNAVNMSASRWRAQVGARVTF
ncbi:MAG: TonB-dependent receptor [Gemmatimonadota bacterium]|nr:TonB-dependent receptor [Gemmatimonadota bacterium]